MYKTLLVDDETRALSGIERTFRWADFGFTVVCATTDPVAALDYLRSEKVDIAFVDIRMPELSGLDIIRISQEEGLPAKFVIVSGYSEFEFAREALQRGVIDYCLKPIRNDAAASLLERAAKRLNLANTASAPSRSEEPLFDPVAVGQRFDDPYPNYCAAVCVGDQFGEETPGSNSPRFLEGDRVVCMRGSDELIYVINHQSANPRTSLGPRRGAWRVGFGRVRSDIASMPLSIQEARTALSAYAFYPERRVFSYTPVHFSAIDSIVLELQDALATGMIIAVENFFESLPKRIKTEKLMPWDTRVLEERLFNRAGATRQNENRLPPPISESIDGFSTRMRSIVLKTICPEARQAFSVPASNSRVWNMLRFVYINIDSRITLAELSERFHFNTNYGCELFKKHTGMTFSQYIIRMKLWHARKLLSQSDLPVAVVAERVGYDYYHFNKLFKRIEGVTPKNYRDSTLI